MSDDLIVVVLLLVRNAVCVSVGLEALSVPASEWDRLYIYVVVVRVLSSVVAQNVVPRQIATQVILRTKPEKTVQINQTCFRRSIATIRIPQ